MGKGYEIQFSMFINKVLLAHGHSQSLIYHRSLLSCNNDLAEELRQRLCDPQSLKYLLDGSLQIRCADSCSSLQYLHYKYK